MDSRISRITGQQSALPADRHASLLPGAPLGREYPRHGLQRVACEQVVECARSPQPSARHSCQFRSEMALRAALPELAMRARAQATASGSGTSAVIYLVAGPLRCSCASGPLVLERARARLRCEGPAVSSTPFKLSLCKLSLCSLRPSSQPGCYCQATLAA